jgi:hypothetical protein
MALQAGFALSANPEGLEMPVGDDASECRLVENFAGLLTSCSDAATAALIGGSCRLWIPAVLLIERGGGQLPELYSFVTRRLRDGQGRFVFQPARLARLAFCGTGSHMKPTGSSQEINLPSVCESL